METNYFGPMRMAQAFAPVLRDNGGGALVNVLSVLSFISMPQARDLQRVEGRRVVAHQRAAHGAPPAKGRSWSPCTPGSSTPTWPPASTPRRSAPSPSPTQIVAAIEAGAEEVLADPTSEMVKAALSDDLTALYPALQAQWDAAAAVDEHRRETDDSRSIVRRSALHCKGLDAADAA